MEVSPAKVRAFDGDEAINEPISYKLIDNGINAWDISILCINLLKALLNISLAIQDGLDVSLVSGHDGVDVQLNAEVGEQNKKMAFIVIEVQ